jgi:hypothetical protein
MEWNEKTRLEVKTRPAGSSDLERYVDEEGNKVLISALVDCWSVVEVGYAPKGSKKERIDIGEIPGALLIKGSEDDYSVPFNNSINLYEDQYRARYSIDTLREVTSHCRELELTAEEAYEHLRNYFIEQEGFNEPTISEDEIKDKF